MKQFLAIILTIFGLNVRSLQAETVVIMGSDTIGAKAALHLAEAFKAKMEAIDREVGFEISAEGSSAGVVSITECHADIGMTSRAPSTKEVARAKAVGV